MSSPSSPLSLSSINSSIKLYKMDSSTVPEYGRSYDFKEEYFLTSSLDDLLKYLEDKRSLYFSNLLVYRKYYPYDREEKVYKLTEIKVTPVLYNLNLTLDTTSQPNYPEDVDY